MDNKSIQELLSAAGYYGGKIDGIMGEKSRNAVQLILERNKPEALTWTQARRNVAAAQVILAAAGHHPGDVDGYAGHNTRNAFDEWQAARQGKPLQLPGRSEREVQASKSKPGKWPTQKGVPDFFGPAGSLACTAGTVNLPLPFRISWNLSQKVKTFRCHEKVADAFTSIYTKAARHYGEGEFTRLGLDIWGGCYNYRPMRGGTALSMHAFGIAVDQDPERNQLRWGRDRAEFAKPDYDPFWAIVEAHGAVSLGRARNFDWMHFQFANL